MDTTNTHTPMNRTLVVIDGDGNVTANVPSPPKSQNPKLLDQVRQAIWARHYSDKTEKAYVHWTKRYIFFHDKRHPQDMAEAEISSWTGTTNRLCLTCPGGPG